MQEASGAGIAVKLLVVWLTCTACGSSSGGSSNQEGGAGGQPGASSAGHAANAGKSSGSDAGGEAGDAGGDNPTETALGLWYGGVALSGFLADQLQASGKSAPQVMVPVESLTAVLDAAFDPAGNVWVVGSGSDNLFRFSAKSLEKLADATPDLVISSPPLNSPASLAFDASGSLWVATRPPLASGMVEDGIIFRFDVPDGESGTLKLDPAVQITSAATGDLNVVGNIAFDASQNLWVSSLEGLLRFDDPTSVEGTVALEPDAVVERTGYTNNIFFYSVAFDSKGSLWAASGDGLHYLTSITKFADPGSLVGRSSPDAKVTIQGEVDLLPAGGIAFDDSGNLWFARANGLVRYAGVNSLRGSVNPDPDITLTVEGKAAPSTSSHLFFAPTPASN